MRVRRYAISVIGAALLSSGCGGSQPPIGTPVGVTNAVSVEHSTTSSSGDLLYVSDPERNVVEIYSYPQRTMVGQLSGVSTSGMCTDAQGDIYVTQPGASTIVEYNHGGTTPINTLNDPGMVPSGCAVDPVTGDLAVSNSCKLNKSGCNGHPTVFVYRQAQGSPREYKDADFGFYYYCGYDSKGDLFVDGTERSAGQPFALAELPKNKHQLKTISVHLTYSEVIETPGAVQWDGKYLAVGSAQGEHIKPAVYRIAVPSGRVVAKIPLQHTQSVVQFFLDGNVLIAPNAARRGGQVLFYDYPSGKKLHRETIDGLYAPTSAVVSSR